MLEIRFPRPSERWRKEERCRRFSGNGTLLRISMFALRFFHGGVKVEEYLPARSVQRRSGDDFRDIDRNLYRQNYQLTDEDMSSSASCSGIGGLSGSHWWLAVGWKITSLANHSISPGGQWPIRALEEIDVGVGPTENGVFGIRYVICHVASQISKSRPHYVHKLCLYVFIHEHNVTKPWHCLCSSMLANPDVSSSMVPSALSTRLRCHLQCFLRPHCLPFSAGQQALIVSPGVALLASLRSSTYFCQNISPFIKVGLELT